MGSRAGVLRGRSTPATRCPALTVTVDETQMFFFSAATYNGHRIHYDKEWARDGRGL